LFGSESKISTSYSERLNLSVRMHTRQSNAHSKSARHHAAMMALFVAWYNFCRKNLALDKGKAPAMACKLADKLWTLNELLKKAATC
jgi:hypothetical protein